jgi:trehalose 6-phosphate phosphatase
MPAMSMDDVVRCLDPPERAAVILDIDGTLAPIVPRPELSAVPETTREAIAALVGRYALVGVVSGRTTEQAMALVDVPGVRVIGSYGVLAPPLPERLIADVEALAATVAGAWVERKGASVAVHVRQTTDPDAAERSLAPPLAAIGVVDGLELIPGKRVLELVPADRPRKGASVTGLLRDTPVDAALYAGDDLADLEAFAALDALSAEGLRAVRIAVHGDETPAALESAADLVVDGTEGLADLLREL